MYEYPADVSIGLNGPRNQIVNFENWNHSIRWSPVLCLKYVVKFKNKKKQLVFILNIYFTFWKKKKYIDNLTRVIVKLKLIVGFKWVLVRII